MAVAHIQNMADEKKEVLPDSEKSITLPKSRKVKNLPTAL